MSGFLYNADVLITDCSAYDALGPVIVHVIAVGDYVPVAILSGLAVSGHYSFVLN